MSAITWAICEVPIMATAIAFTVSMKSKRKAVLRKYTIFKKLERWHVVHGPRKSGIWMMSYETWQEAVDSLAAHKER
jgi:hypothetical protein